MLTHKSHLPDRTELFLGALAFAMLIAVLAAIVRGFHQWHLIAGLVWLHLATIVATLALTPAILWRPRGTRLHRRLGYGWVFALGTTAVASFGIRTNSGHFSIIHLLSAYTLFALVYLVVMARRQNHLAHRRTIRGLCIGALLIAGFFTFPFGRLMGRWLFG